MRGAVAVAVFVAHTGRCCGVEFHRDTARRRRRQRNLEGAADCRDSRGLGCRGDLRVGLVGESCSARHAPIPKTTWSPADPSSASAAASIDAGSWATRPMPSCASCTSTVMSAAPSCASASSRSCGARQMDCACWTSSIRSRSASSCGRSRRIDAFRCGRSRPKCRSARRRCSSCGCPIRRTTRFRSGVRHSP